MCGICGYIELDLTTHADEGIVGAIARRLAHRGPDDQGVWSKGPVALGHRRLSIIDLEGGHQPLSNEDGTIWVVFNGEIYNFPELTEELIGKGHRFRTHCDTEVLVHLYEEEGPEFVNRLNGMFAVAIWDDVRRELILLRDRMGEKPLYWGVFDDKLIFASELKAILVHPSVDRELDVASLSRYLATSTVPAPYSIFRGIHKLPPAGRLVARRGKPLVDTYWSYPLNQPRLDIGLREAEVRFLELAREAVRRRLISDVPLGVFLSGGLDSSTIAALMCEVSGQTVNSFTIGFENPAFDESSYARHVAEQLGTIHHEEILSPAPHWSWSRDLAVCWTSLWRTPRSFRRTSCPSSPGGISPSPWEAMAATSYWQAIHCMPLIAISLGLTNCPEPACCARRAASLKGFPCGWPQEGQSTG